MGFSNLSPNWFFGWDVVLELSFAFIVLFVSIFAFKIYKKSSQESVKLMSLSFLFISISYFIKSFFNFLIIRNLNENICKIIKVRSIIIFDTYGILIHMFFMMIGLVILAFMTFKSRNFKILWLMLIISLSGLFFSKNSIYVFYLFSSIYLIFISIHFIKNYLKNKQVKILFIAIAFLFLLFGSIHFLFSVNYKLFYVLGHMLELIAYLLILINLYLVLKK